uniref:Nucleotid_trans domain-containing protein n=1 Tax=Mesocestoides corti TaxID=53468 RepID=A0A5K3EXL5_MESCO
MDPDTLFLTDISELWKEFKKFSPNQFYAMAADQAPTRYNFPKVYGWRFTEGYNGGLVLWYASRAPQEKWDAIWKPVFANFDKPKIFLPAAEQTVMTLTAILNPEIFYALDCTWNLQLSFDCKPYNCLSKWTSSDPNAPKPKVMHGSGAGKQFGKFALEKPKHPLVNLNQFRKAFVYERSLLLLHNDYAFRRRIERNEPFDFRKAS